MVHRCGLSRSVGRRLERRHHRGQSDYLAPYFRLLESDFRFSVFFSRNLVFGSHQCFGFRAVFSAPAGKAFSVPRLFAVPSGTALQFPLKVLRCPLWFFGS